MKVPSKSRLRKQYNNKKKTQTKKQTKKPPQNRKVHLLQQNSKIQNPRIYLACCRYTWGVCYNCIGSSIVAAGWITR